LCDRTEVTTIAIGFALKKILKWVSIIVGFLAEMFFVGVQLLQKNGFCNR
jgi:uncharacterized membrane protein (Fun14 family)